MKKIILVLAAAVMVFTLAACGSSAGEEAETDNDTAAETAEAADEEAVDEAEAEEQEEAPESVTIKTFDESKEEIEIEVPYNPERVAVMDLAILDMLDNFGVGDRVAGVSKGSSIDYLQDYVTDDTIVNLGTIKEADLEAVMECEPEIIFIGGRLSSQYEALSEIAPVVYLGTDVEKGVVESTRDNALNVASIFGVEDVVTDLLADYDARIAVLTELAKGNTAVVGMINAGGFGVLGNDGRCSIIGVEIGFENIGLEAASSSERGGGDGEGGGRGEGEGRGEESSENSEGATATHGNEASFEVLVSLDADYIFVMDRDAAINTEGAQLAEEVFDNELVHMTAAYQNDNIVYLEHSNVWYTAEGGITALGIMLDDLESALLN